MGQRMRRFTRIHRGRPAARHPRGSGAGDRPHAVIRGLTNRVDSQIQLNESNLAFMRRLLADYDADMQVVGDRAAHRAAQRRPARQPHARHGRPAQAGAHLRRSRRSGDQRDPCGLRRRPGPAGVGPEHAHRSRSRLGPYRQRSSCRRCSGARAEHLGDRAVHDQAEAQALVAAAHARRARRFVTLEGTCEGNPALRVGTHVTIEGVGPRFPNTYYVTSACHRFDRTVGYADRFHAPNAAIFGG